MNKIIGILGFQGAFFEHKNILDQLKVSNLIVKTNKDLQKIDYLIIPGGESTVISKFINEQNLLMPLKEFILEEKRPVMGTCAGAILLSKIILDKNDLNLIGGLTEHKSLCHRFMDLKRLGLREIFKDPANFLNDNNLHLSNGFFQYQLSKKKIYFSLFRK